MAGTPHPSLYGLRGNFILSVIFCTRLNATYVPLMFHYTPLEKVLSATQVVILSAPQEILFTPCRDSAHRESVLPAAVDGFIPFRAGVAEISPVGHILTVLSGNYAEITIPGEGGEPLLASLNVR